MGVEGRGGGLRSEGSEGEVKEESGAKKEVVLRRSSKERGERGREGGLKGRGAEGRGGGRKGLGGLSREGVKGEVSQGRFEGWALQEGF